MATSAQIEAQGIAFDRSGNLFLAEPGRNRVRKIVPGLDGITGAPDEIITTVAGTGMAGFTGDGGAAMSAQFSGPFNVAIDGEGNLFIADLSNHRVRKVVLATGIITTVAGGGTTGLGDGGPATSAQLFHPYGLAFDTSGNLFIADNRNHRIRKVVPGSDGIAGAPDEIMTTVAGSGPVGPDPGSLAGDGGPATSARLNRPQNIALDMGGNLFISENFNDRIRKVIAGLDGITGAPDEIITTVAGSGPPSEGVGVPVSGDGGPATSARLNLPNAIVFNKNGNLFFSDGAGGRIRRILAVIEVLVDIKPGSFPNSINLGSGGTVPVAILSSVDFDATTVDPTTVTLAGASVQLKGKGTPMAAFQDVNGDGLLDLVVHVTTEAMELSEVDTEAVLDGKTFDGTRIRGTDSVRVVP